MASMTSTTSRVTTTDGLTLAVYETPGPSATPPTVVAVHGYPDDHTVWAGVAAELSGRFRVVTYDVRGAGASDCPRGRAAYRIEQLVADLRSVLDAVSPDAPVHLLGHDWGSIWAWDAVTDESFADRLLTFTSVSGPSLDMVGAWMRQVREHPRPVLSQLLASYYVMLYQLPWLPERLASLGLVQRVAGRSAAYGLDGRPSSRVGSDADAVQGIGLYRANFWPRLTRPRPRRAVVPVLVLAPRLDLHVNSEMQRATPAPYVEDLRTHEIDGNHWVVANDPALIAGYVEGFTNSARA
jgi:pimeloyl-ACP methyl ester carboxylesterase